MSLTCSSKILLKNVAVADDGCLPASLANDECGDVVDVARLLLLSIFEQSRLLTTHKRPQPCPCSLSPFRCQCRN
ncbi:hypothetical protein QQG55_39950 [Brugia pahangi]|uniref:Uncharacterized protein n=1 Tax=Brugia pahangi TaxID=6280 RepID=A0A0N4TL86_BRUPA|nr:unnamed protein product [Brugia pahangi]